MPLKVKDSSHGDTSNHNTAKTSSSHANHTGLHTSTSGAGAYRTGSVKLSTTNKANSGKAPLTPNSHVNNEGNGVSGHRGGSSIHKK